MSNFEDRDLESRLRRVASGALPEPPISLYRSLRQVAAGRGSAYAGVVREPVRPIGRSWLDFRRAGILAGVAAVLFVAVAVTGLLMAQRGPGTGSTWAPRTDVGTGEWTAIEWHDITATAGGLMIPGLSGNFGLESRAVARWAGGVAMMGGDYRIWTSADGISWSESATSPWLAGVVPTPDRTALLAYGTSDRNESLKDSTLWRSVDGRTWQRVSAPFNGGGVGLAAGSVGDLAVGRYAWASQTGQTAIWFTADGATWTADDLPSDMASAWGVIVTAFGSGFVAVGYVEDPNGNMSNCDDQGNCTRYSDRAWRSLDGRTWSVYVAGVLPTSQLPWNRVLTGSLGMTDGSTYSTDGGAHWRVELEMQRVSLTGIASDGARVVGVSDGGARFYLTEGNGHWTELRQGGDVGNLPADGSLSIVPSGILWIGTDHVYFGQALSGIEPRGSMGPPVTSSPGPTLPYPTSTPAARITPQPSQPAADFNTPGSAQPRPIGRA